MKTEGQYTLDADPMTLAKRVTELEDACDIAAGALLDLTDATRLLASQCELALSESHPLQAGAICDLHDKLTHIRDRAHAMGAKLGRSY